MGTKTENLQSLLDSALPFIRGELELIDPDLPRLIAVLRSSGASECWHKHGDFLHHLVSIFRILSLWKSPHPLALCGLFHSAYSNSYVNLAIFPPETSRPYVQSLIGPQAEDLVHMFCVVPRQSLIHDDLLFHFSDTELESAFMREEVPESLRDKIQRLVPPYGVTVKHIRTGQDLVVPRRLVASFLLMTIADFSDQLFGFQDELFENSNGRLEFSGNNITTLWPGDGKPGLWVNSLSRMAVLYRLLVREEERRESENGFANGGSKRGYEEIELVVPPVFENCTMVLSCQDEREARDLYWEVVCGGGGGKIGLERQRELLVRCIEKNPFVGEPHVLLAQIYVMQGRYEEGEREGERGLKLMLEWGSNWDKRVSWEGWVAWNRVLIMKAKERSWPQTSWGILNLGLVR
ncbi:uncharacterized protein LOC18438415 [Amborella trichopoda]|uniref:DUF6817 domain-containing protein n=1 Tax=Amborella trichopoda TaxID=13333 RepID=W1PQB9_AMBTC|nr:uncharacterized protein LOC18438415 [Amborella trichopoda]ERN10243.1 hypothetical protein AMTR_s00171p00069250 [Amborella trichopoda]|eukprot:XP_006848662.1 uncharacterized protein LOC18438415 [Amborella trichopoda]